MRMQAKDIPDEVFIAAVQKCSVEAAKQWGNDDAWCNRMDVQTELESVMGIEIPWKIVIAKANAMIKKKRMNGCTCGCRGDFDLRGFPDDPWLAAREAKAQAVKDQQYQAYLASMTTKCDIGKRW